jgi:hypothetical protein
MNRTHVDRVSRGPSALLSIAAALLVTACVATSLPAPSVSPSTATSAPSAIPSLALESVQPTTPVEDPGDGVEFQLPAPTCPSPPGAVIVPDVRVSIGDGPGIIATRGATTFSTCTTTSAVDVAGDAPLPWLTATHEDRVRLQVQSGWRIIRIQGYDHPAVGDGRNVDSAILLPDGPDRVDMAVPHRNGDAMAGWTLWLVRVDGRAVGQLDVAIRIHLPRTAG